MNFPFHKQSDTMQCGITCLRMILEYYGHKYSSSCLSELCHSTVEGVSMLGIGEAAKKLGLNVTCGYLSIDTLNHIQLPCILHWDQKHFVVLYKVKNSKLFYIADPGKGLIRYSMNEFIAHWIHGRFTTKNE